MTDTTQRVTDDSADLIRRNEIAASQMEEKGLERVADLHRRSAETIATLLVTVAELTREIERLKAVETERDELRVSIVDLDRVVDQLDIANTTCDPAEMIAELQSLNATLAERVRVLEAALNKIAACDGLAMGDLLDIAVAALTPSKEA